MSTHHTSKGKVQVLRVHLDDGAFVSLPVARLHTAQDVADAICRKRGFERHLPWRLTIQSNQQKVSSPAKNGSDFEEQEVPPESALSPVLGSFDDKISSFFLTCEPPTRGCMKIHLKDGAFVIVNYEAETTLRDAVKGVDIQLQEGEEVRVFISPAGSEDDFSNWEKLEPGMLVSAALQTLKGRACLFAMPTAVATGRLRSSSVVSTGSVSPSMGRSISAASQALIPEDDVLSTPEAPSGLNNSVSCVQEMERDGNTATPASSIGKSSPIEPGDGTPPFPGKLQTSNSFTSSSRAIKVVLPDRSFKTLAAKTDTTARDILVSLQRKTMKQEVLEYGLFLKASRFPMSDGAFVLKALKMQDVDVMPVLEAKPMDAAMLTPVQVPFVKIHRTDTGGFITVPVDEYSTVDTVCSDAMKKLHLKQNQRLQLTAVTNTDTPSHAHSKGQPSADNGSRVLSPDEAIASIDLGNVTIEAQVTSVELFTEEMLSQMREEFADIDTDGSGTIELQELKSLVQGMGEVVSLEELTALFHRHDTDGNGGLDFDEYIQLMYDLRTRNGKVEQGLSRAVARRMERFRVVRSDDGSVVRTVDSVLQRVIVNFINESLVDDVHVCSKLPLNLELEELGEALKDGIIIAKLLNRAKPGSVSMQQLNLASKGRKLSPWQVAENTNLVLRGAIAAGCRLVNIGAADIADGKAALVLTLLWQIVRLELSSAFCLSTRPELIVLKQEEESLEAFLKHPPEEIALRWVRMLVLGSCEGAKTGDEVLEEEKRAGDAEITDDLRSRRSRSMSYSLHLPQLKHADGSESMEVIEVQSFARDFVDGRIWVKLGEALLSSSLDEAVHQCHDPVDRAAHICAAMEAQGLFTFIAAPDVVSGDPQFVFALLCQLAKYKHGLSYLLSDDELVHALCKEISSNEIRIPLPSQDALLRAVMAIARAKEISTSAVTSNAQRRELLMCEECGKRFWHTFTGSRKASSRALCRTCKLAASAQHFTIDINSLQEMSIEQVLAAAQQPLSQVQMCASCSSVLAGVSWHKEGNEDLTYCNGCKEQAEDSDQETWVRSEGGILAEFQVLHGENNKEGGDTVAQESLESEVKDNEVSDSGKDNSETVPLDQEALLGIEEEIVPVTTVEASPRLEEVIEKAVVHRLNKKCQLSGKSMDFLSAELQAAKGSLRSLTSIITPLMVSTSMASISGLSGAGSFLRLDSPDLEGWVALSTMRAHYSRMLLLLKGKKLHMFKAPHDVMKKRSLRYRGSLEIPSLSVLPCPPKFGLVHIQLFSSHLAYSMLVRNENEGQSWLTALLKAGAKEKSSGAAHNSASVTEDHNAATVFSGALSKRKRRNRSLKVFSFKKRHCLLNSEGSLYYFRHSSDALPQGAVRMSTTNLQTKLPWQDDLTFDLEGKNFRYSFRCETAKDFEDWTRHLSQFAQSYTQGTAALQAANNSSEESSKAQANDDGEIIENMLTNTTSNSGHVSKGGSSSLQSELSALQRDVLYWENACMPSAMGEFDLVTGHGRSKRLFGVLLGHSLFLFGRLHTSTSYVHALPDITIHLNFMKTVAADARTNSIRLQVLDKVHILKFRDPYRYSHWSVALSSLLSAPSIIDKLQHHDMLPDPHGLRAILAKRSGAAEAKEGQNGDPDDSVSEGTTEEDDGGQNEVLRKKVAALDMMLTNELKAASGIAKSLRELKDVMTELVKLLKVGDSASLPMPTAHIDRLHQVFPLADDGVSLVQGCQDCETDDEGES